MIGSRKRGREEAFGTKSSDPSGDAGDDEFAHLFDEGDSQDKAGTGHVAYTMGDEYYSDMQGRTPGADSSSSRGGVSEVRARRYSRASDKGAMSTDDATKLVLNLVEAQQTNEKMRVKHAGEPREFMESEAELHAAVGTASDLAAQPEHFATAVRAGLCDVLRSLLRHENEDIVADTLEMLEEMTETDALAEQVEGGSALVGGLESSGALAAVVEAGISLDLAARARPPAPAPKEDAGVAGKASKVKVQELSDQAEARVAAQEAAGRAREGLGSALSVLGHVLEFRPEAGDLLATSTPLLAWLLARLRGATAGPSVAEDDECDHDSAELLAVLLGYRGRARQVLGTRAGAWGPAAAEPGGAAQSADSVVVAAPSLPHSGVASVLQASAAPSSAGASGATQPKDEAGGIALAGSDGVEALLLAASGALRREPETMPQQEAIECVFAAVRGALAEPACRALFRRHEGTELLVRVAQRQGYASHCAVAALETALTQDPDACIACVEAGALKVLPAVARGAARAVTRRHTDGETANEEERQAAACLSWLLQLLPGGARDAPMARRAAARATAVGAAGASDEGDGPVAFGLEQSLRLRVLAKMMEGDGLVLARMVEIYRDLGAAVAQADNRVLSGLQDAGVGAPGGGVLAAGSVTVGAGAGAGTGAGAASGSVVQVEDPSLGEHQFRRDAALRDAGVTWLMRLAEALARCSLGDRRCRMVVLGRMRELGVPRGGVSACLAREAGEVAKQEGGESGSSQEVNAKRAAELVALAEGWAAVCGR